MKVMATVMYLRYIPYCEYIIRYCDVRVLWSWGRMLEKTRVIWKREADGYKEV